MYNSGFVIVYRDEVEDWLWQDPQLYHWWSFLRMKATPRPCLQTVGRTRIRVRLNYGEYATTISYLARIWDVDERTITSFLDLMEEDGRIEVRKENGISIIRIVGYEKFSPPAGYFAKGVKRNKPNHMGDEMTYETQGQRSDELENEDQSQTLDEMTSRVQSGVQPNNIILEEDKIKNKSPSPEREAEFFEKLKNSEIALEQMAMTLKLTNVSAVLEQLEIFENFILGDSNKFHQNFSDFTSHFIRWFNRCRVTNESRNSKKHIDGTKEEKTSSSRRAASQRRGSEGSGRNADDYDQPFPTLNE